MVALAEEDGDVVERFIYDAYGKVTVLDPAFTADADNTSDYAWTHLYTGRPLDPETGLMDRKRVRTIYPLTGGVVCGNLRACLDQCDRLRTGWSIT